MTLEIGDSTLLDTWASDGLIVEPLLAKKEAGWLLGEQPPHEYMNWLQNTFGQKLNHILQNGVPEWNATTAYRVNDFAKNDGVIFRAINSNTNSEPPSGNWVAIGPFNAQHSIEIDTDDQKYQLVGDTATPGNLKYYGTNSGGDRGFHTLPATGFETGDVKLAYDLAEKAGYVRLNGRTIGSAASAGTERANADTEALFLFLWTKDANLTVSGGRGASAAADFAADKRINLPDWRGRVPVCADGFGSSNTGRVSATGDGNPGLDATVLGNAGGADRITLTVEQLAEHVHGIATIEGAVGGVNNGAAEVVAPDYVATPPLTTAVDRTTVAEGEDEPHPNLQPSTIAGYYIKL